MEIVVLFLMLLDIMLKFIDVVSIEIGSAILIVSNILQLIIIVWLGIGLYRYKYKSNQDDSSIISIIKSIFIIIVVRLK